MEPFELALAAIASSDFTKKALEKGFEKTVEMATEAGWPLFFKQAKNVELTGSMFGQLATLGNRLQPRVPDDINANPFGDPVILAEILEPERQDPDMANIIEAIEKKLPPLPPVSQQIGNRIQKGNIANDNATIEFKGNVTQTF